MCLKECASFHSRRIPFITKFTKWLLARVFNTFVRNERRKKWRAISFFFLYRIRIKMWRVYACIGGYCEKKIGLKADAAQWTQHVYRENVAESTKHQFDKHFFRGNSLQFPYFPLKRPDEMLCRRWNCHPIHQVILRRGSIRANDDDRIHPQLYCAAVSVIVIATTSRC